MRPQPVLKAAAVAFCTQLLAAAVAFGAPLTHEQTAGVLGVIGTGATLLGVVLAIRAAGKVTPLESPQNDQGVPLMPRTARVI